MHKLKDFYYKHQTFFDKAKEFILKYHVIEFIISGLIYAFMGIFYTLALKINSDVSLAHEVHWKIDEMIPMVKPFVIFYYLYYIIPPLFCWISSFYSKKRFVTLMISIYSCILIAFTIYCFYQVHMVRPVLEGSDIFTTMIRWMYEDADPLALNCCPSLHTVMGTFTALALLGIKKAPWWSKVIGIICGIGITISTLFIKQHYVLDVLCGLALALIVYFIVVLCVNIYLKHKEKKVETIKEN